MCVCSKHCIKSTLFYIIVLIHIYIYIFSNCILYGTNTIYILYLGLGGLPAIQELFPSAGINRLIVCHVIFIPLNKDFFSCSFSYEDDGDHESLCCDIIKKVVTINSPNTKIYKNKLFIITSSNVSFSIHNNRIII